VAVSAFESSEEKHETYAIVNQMWTGRRRRGLAESIDVLEVFDFVWGFLVRKVFADITDIKSWLTPTLGGIAYGLVIDNQKCSENETWHDFLSALVPQIRPANIIELVAL
jgi:hypothetical protein